MQLNLSQPIASVQIQKPAVKAAVQYVIVNFDAKEWATIRLLLLDADGNAIAAHDVPMTLAESQAWAGDDKYVLTLALKKLGINNVAI